MKLVAGILVLAQGSYLRPLTNGYRSRFALAGKLGRSLGRFWEDLYPLMPPFGLFAIWGLFVSA